MVVGMAIILPSRERHDWLIIFIYAHPVDELTLSFCRRRSSHLLTTSMLKMHKVHPTYLRHMSSLRELSLELVVRTLDYSQHLLL